MHGGLWGLCWVSDVQRRPRPDFHIIVARQTFSIPDAIPESGLPPLKSPRGRFAFYAQCNCRPTLIGNHLLQLQQLNMEATAALGIAGNIVQFIDFSQKLYKTIFQIYNSATGTTKHSDETEILINSFTSSLDVISADLSKYCAHLSSAVPGDASNNDPEVSYQMQVLVRSCREVAVELQRHLDSVKVKGQQPGKRKAMLVAVKAMWKEKRFQDVEQTLIRFRKELQWIVLVSLRSVPQHFGAWVSWLTDTYTERASICWSPDKKTSSRRFRPPCPRFCIVSSRPT